MPATTRAIPLLFALALSLVGANTPTSITLQSSANPSVLAHGVTLTASVNPPAATGSVTFYDGAAILGSAKLAGGQAVLTTRYLPALANPLKAYYGGDASYAPSTSVTLLQTVNALTGGEFQPANSSTIGTQAQSIATGDFDGDGKLDLVATGFSNTVSVLLGIGNGTFQKAVNYNLGSAGFGVTVGDFNGDGKADLAVTTNDNAVSVFLGIGNGSFSPPASYPVLQSISGIAVGDFNGDGKADLVVTEILGNVDVLLGNGDGSFGSPLRSSAGAYLRSLATGDFNGDGKTDLVVPDSSSNNVIVLLGKGDGTFLSPVLYGPAGYPTGVAAGDLNGDGKTDLAVANLTGNVSVLLGNGNGTFQAPVNYRAGQSPSAVAIGDWNGDGKADLVVLNSNDGTAEVFQGDGSGGFQAIGTYPVGGYPMAVAVGDFNGDGRADLAAANELSGDASTLLNLPAAPDLSVSVTHFGNFVPGQNTGEQYQITVSNLGSLPTSGLVTLTDTLPSGFTATYVNGAGWTCSDSPVSCSRGDSLPAFSSYPAIAVVVSIAVGSPASATNTAAVSGGGETNPANNTASDFVPAFTQSQIDAAWTMVSTPAGLSNSSTALLLTDGSVMVQQYCSGNWFRLAPDAFGNYATGTWSQAAPMPPGYAPLYFSSAVLADGRLVTIGGEYNLNCTAGAAETALGAIYDPTADTWASLAAPTGWTRIGDASNVVLPNGQFLLGASYNDGCCQFASLDPATLTWTLRPGAGKADYNEEEGWTLLPDGSVLTVDTQTVPGAERYLPQTDTWVSAGSTAALLIGHNEIGAQLLRPDGTVFVGGATGHTAVYNVAAGTWTAGPDFPVSDGNLLVDSDSPAALLPSGNALLPVSPGVFFEFNGTTLNPVPPSPGTAYCFALLPLPNGQTLCSWTGIALYTSSGSPNPAWAPAITSVPNSLQPGQTYTVSGTQFNGLSQAVGYGDDYQAATNYPLVRIVNTATGHVFYCRTHDHSTMGVATGATPVSTRFDVPYSIEVGPSTLVVVANGIASQPVNVTLTGPSLKLSASGLPFGNQVLGVASSPQTVTLNSIGTVSTNISSVSLSGANSGDFGVSSACTGALAAGSHCALSVTFKPLGFGARTATLTINDNIAAPQTVSLTGTGTTGLPLVQAIINQVLGVARPVNDLNGDGAVNVLDVQASMNPILGRCCALY